MAYFLSEKEYEILLGFPFFRDFKTGKYTNPELFISNLESFKTQLISLGVNKSNIELLMQWAKNKSDEIRQHKIAIFLGVYQAIRDYNETHSLGKSLAQLLFDVTDLKDSEIRKRQERVIKNAEEKARLARAIGLQLDFNVNKGVSIFGPDVNENKSPHPKELRVNIVDARRFLEFLSSLKQEDFNQHESLKNGLILVINILTKQVVNYYDFNLSDDRLIELLGYGNALVKELERLGMADYTQIFKQYVNEAHLKRVREFHILSKTYCFDKPSSETYGRGGLSRFHRDTTVEEYKQKWERTLEAVNFALKNKNALPLTKLVVDNLILCGLFALEDMKKLEKDLHYKEKIPILRSIVKRYIKLYQDLKNKLYK